MQLNKSIAGVGKVNITNGVVTKVLSLNTNGSAYMKIPGQICAIKQAGYSRIRLRINKSCPYLSRIETQVSLMRQIVPQIDIEKY